MRPSSSRPRLRSRVSVYTGRVTNDPHINLPSVPPVDSTWILRAEKHQLNLTKPPGSLGRLEEIANRCVAIAESMTPTVSRPRIVVFAGDHGVCAEGVSPYPQAVTAQMVLNFLHGGAAINALACAAGADLRVVDAGVASAIPEHAGLLRRRIADGTRNFCVEAAMTREQTLAALQVGVEMADEAARRWARPAWLRRNGNRQHDSRQCDCGAVDRPSDRSSCGPRSGRGRCDAGAQNGGPC